MEWNGNLRMEYGRCQLAEWNGMEDFKNGMENNLPYFHTDSILDLQKSIYGCQVEINNIVAEVFHSNTYVYYLSANRGTLVVFIAHAVYGIAS